MELVDFITSLAPEGESALVVQQKTKAWIPQLPDAPRRPGKAWYISSGSFIIDRMKGGLSASAANCTHVLFLGLDDVGTKSKIPPLAPTWIIETSPMNYQYGYALSVQATTGVAAAAERAFAEAGYTDGGAISPVRNFRIPGSVNLKEGRDNWASVLTEAITAASSSERRPVRCSGPPCSTTHARNLALSHSAQCSCKQV